MRSTFVVVYDACVLHSAVMRDFLLRLAGTELFQAKWSERIINEVIGSIITRQEEKGRPITVEQAEHLAERMRLGVPDSIVDGYETLETGIDLPNPDDRHVVAVGIRSGARVIVTDNLADFPDQAISPFGLEALSADQFVLGVLDLPGGEIAVLRALESQSRALSRPARSPPELVAGLEHSGLVASAARMRELT